MRVELEQLRQRTVTLEQQAEAARQQNLALGDVANQLNQMRANLDEQQQLSRASVQQTADARGAITNLLAAEHALASGDTNVGTIVDANQLATLPPHAQAELNQALTSLANEDLGVARYYLLQAAQDARGGR